MLNGYKELEWAPLYLFTVLWVWCCHRGSWLLQEDVRCSALAYTKSFVLLQWPLRQDPMQLYFWKMQTKQLSQLQFEQQHCSLCRKCWAPLYSTRNHNITTGQEAKSSSVAICSEQREPEQAAGAMQCPSSAPLIQERVKKAENNTHVAWCLGLPAAHESFSAEAVAAKLWERESGKDAVFFWCTNASIKGDVPVVFVSQTPDTDPCCCWDRLGATNDFLQGGAAQSASAQTWLCTQIYGG